MREKPFPSKFSHRFFFSLVNFLAHAQDAWSEAGVNCALKIPRVPYLFDQPPWRLLNFLTLRMGAYSRLGAN